MTVTDDEPIAEAAYDALADEYAEEVEASAYNAELEFPGTVALVPDVDGKRVLDAGCGNGRYTEWLLERGADVVAVDASEEMLAHATERVDDRAGDRATFHRADLGRRLPFADDGEFDGVVSALVLDYVPDWAATFAEFARVLVPGGFVVASVSHPFDEFHLPERANYFDVEERTKEWSVDVPYYRRPLARMVNPILDAGFRLDELAEPQPTEGFRERRPERYERESKRPVFLSLRAVKD